MGAFRDLTGERFGKLTVLALSHRVKRVGIAIYWRCRCDCGKESTHQGANLKSGATTSCGCVRSDVAAKLCAERSTHGLSGTRLHNIWAGMIARCHNPDRNSFRYYGAKGIAVCTAWRSFPAFKEWALANGYAEHLTIDRIDARDGYRPENCRWITHSENARRANEARRAA